MTLGAKAPTIEGCLSRRGTFIFSCGNPEFSFSQVASGGYLEEGAEKMDPQRAPHTMMDTTTVLSKPFAALWGWVKTEKQAQFPGCLRHHSRAHYFWTSPRERRRETHTIGISVCAMWPLYFSYCTQMGTTVLTPPVRTLEGQLMSQPDFKGRRERTGRLMCFGREM